MLDGLVGLRRVRALLPGNIDVARGITALEEALGGAVTQRIAARALDVSHPELSKLIASKKLTTVDTSKGRAQVDVGSLVDMIEAKASETSAPEVTEERLDGRDIDSIMEMRALAFHRALARNLDRPAIARAKEIVSEWRAEGKLDDDAADDWERVLDRPVPDVVSAMTEYSDAGKARRKNSPFSAMGRRASDRTS